MKALQVNTFEDDVQLTEIPTPSPKPSEILLKIEACGLNFADLLMRKGTYQDTPTPPFTLGLEVCGTVEELGTDTTDLNIGDRVAVFGGQGGLAEYGVFPSELCFRISEKMTAEEAAGFQVAYGTSHLALSHRAQLKSGETLVVLGAAGGVGLTAVEIGKLMGATVIAFARGAHKVNIAKEAGADFAYDSDEVDLRDVIKSHGGADVVYDPIGGDQFKAALRACNREARVVVIGFASGSVPQIAANHILVKNITVIGFYWGGYLKFAPERLKDSMTELMEWYDQGKLKPHISHVFKLQDGSLALDTLEARKSTGKVVVTP